MTSNQQSLLKMNIAHWITRLFLIVATIVLLYPFVWNLLASFKSNTEFLTDPFSFPQALHFDNYVRAFQKSKMGSYFLNSIFLVVLSTAILVIFVVPMAYVLTRFKFWGSKLILNLYMACIFLQASYIMVPLFLQVNSFGMLDNRGMLSLIYAVLQFPFAIFVLSGFLKSVPRDYEEAAKIDGCGNTGVLVRIVAPLAKPGIVTVCMLAAMGFWNEYPLALVLIQSDSKKTLPVGLANLFEVQRYATDWSALFAALILVLIPTILLYVIGQKQLLQGISAGGIKG
ncbi:MULTISPECIES: carbohydrate ABC transporter permease [Paenibacillus]|uniref:carbohydrate ABC transporter permease n=1 Tax=Paenibacillus TaxID=44249 RepID=UPI00096CD490|nr:carbohydrate ABC transporter permease [Paenibacillus odorifer]OMD60415.1 ABC transporter [Paenibacillus odorifer]OMD70976.1 ABC transporter [Paenibacillus odorifer]